MKKVNKRVGRVVLALSIALLVLWGVLGTGTSLAWFYDESNEVNNIFNVAKFELAVSQKIEEGYKPIDGRSDIFNTEALYEPGYVEVIYLKIENLGTVPFDVKTAVTVKDYNTAINVFGNSFSLQDHLKFGIVMADSEAELEALLSTREKAAAVADMPLGDYETKAVSIADKGTKFVGLVVRMPETETNYANFVGDPPTVDLMLVMTADQQR